MCGACSLRVRLGGVETTSERKLFRVAASDAQEVVRTGCSAVLTSGLSSFPEVCYPWPSRETLNHNGTGYLKLESGQVLINRGVLTREGFRWANRPASLFEARTAASSLQF